METRTSDEKDRPEVFHAECSGRKWKCRRPINGKLVKGMEEVGPAMALVREDFLEAYSGVGRHSAGSREGLSSHQTRRSFQGFSGYVSRWQTLNLLSSGNVSRLWRESQLMQADTRIYRRARWTVHSMYVPIPDLGITLRYYCGLSLLDSSTIFFCGISKDLQ